MQGASYIYIYMLAPKIGFVLFLFACYKTDWKTIDEQNHKIQSREYNRLVPVWNHIIKIQSSKDGKVNYTDEIHLYAGYLTKFIAWWASCFYRHRQKKMAGNFKKVRKTIVNSMKVVIFANHTIWYGYKV